MLVEPNPTPLDLRWRMFGIRVRVHPTFWLFTLLMGYGFIQKGFVFVLLWVLCTFVSVLIHELGHVIAGRIFGKPGNIILYSFGGLAVGDYLATRRWQRVIIALAGPAAGFALYAGVVLLEGTGFHQNYHRIFSELKFTMRALKFMNLFWGFINLIPVIPLDGGQVLRASLEGVSPKRGFKWALGVSFVIGGLIAFYAGLAAFRNQEGTAMEEHLWWPTIPESHNPLGDDKGSVSLPPIFLGLLFALLAVQAFLTYRALERAEREEREEREEPPIEE